MPKENIYSVITRQLDLPAKSIKNTIELLEGGATIPFISRYRKEATGSLNEVSIGEIDAAWKSYKELIKRKEFVLETIKEQGKLTPSLENQIENCWDSILLEDIYLPYKKKRKTRATKARDRGLEPLANEIWQQKVTDVYRSAKQFLSKEVKTVDDALAGARDIIAERINENNQARGAVRRIYERTATMISKVVVKKKAEAEKYTDYFKYEEAAKKIPGHRFLAVLRGEKEGFLRVKLGIDKEEVLHKLGRIFIENKTKGSCLKQLQLAIEDAFDRLLSSSIETEFRNLYKEKADEEAISVFVENLKQLLLAPPLGTKRIMGIDPGFRSGCKVVCLDENGSLLNDTVIYPHPPQMQAEKAKNDIQSLLRQYKIESIAIGNGTAGKETYALLKATANSCDVELFMVNESGASIYSASEIARKEFPDHDLTVRGAVSIGRRLMDPLSELVKIDPKSIGVGQYQHDVNQAKLKENLTRCVESCVNAVGIDLNTASEHVLTFISGLGPTIASNIVKYREENGSFIKIETLKKVPRMGAKAYEQSAGFLRIRNGKNPLDNTGVHPERYKLVNKMAKDIGVKLESLISEKQKRNELSPSRYITDDVGLPTINDILEELAKPGIDIRGKAKTFEFTSGINSIADVKTGMKVNGVINNVTKFGAFVDIGIKESGLIHISQMADKFISDPLDVVKLNQKVYATVIEVDESRKRISLSLKQ